MNGSINLGISCRNVTLLGATNDEVSAFIDTYVVPAVKQEILSSRMIYIDGASDLGRRDFGAELSQRGCSVSGNLSVTF